MIETLLYGCKINAPKYMEEILYQCKGYTNKKELMEKGQIAMKSMAPAQKDMAEFQNAWQELQDLSPIKPKM